MDSTLQLCPLCGIASHMVDAPWARPAARAGFRTLLTYQVVGENIYRMVEKSTVPEQAHGSIAEKLDGKRLLITGVTGFLGQAVFEKVLSDVPGARIVLLVRPQLGSTGRARVEQLLKR